MDGRLWRNPNFARIFFKYLLAQTVNFKEERYDETRLLTLCTRWISNLPSSLPRKIYAFQCAVYAINVTITDAFSPESQYPPCRLQFQYNSVIGHNFVTYGLPFAVYVERRTTMLNQVVRLLWEPYIACPQDLYSLSRRTPYRKVLWGLKAARFGIGLFPTLWNLTSTSTAALPRWPSNFRAMNYHNIQFCGFWTALKY